MSLLQKFMAKARTEPSLLLVCASTQHMLKADHALREAGIATELLPTPRGIGSACTTVIRFAASHRTEVEKILAAEAIEWEGIYPYSTQPRRIDWSPVYAYPLAADYRELLQRLEREEPLSQEELARLLAVQDEAEEQALLTAGDLVRQECVGDMVDIRGAIEFSNYCRKNCYYCGLRRDNTVLPRYRMSEEEILATVDEIYRLGLRTVILQSGEDPYYTTEKILRLIRTIKERYGLRITLSLGERRAEEYRLLREAGANNYLLKLESGSPYLFAAAHPDDDYGERRRHLQLIKQAGLLSGSGNIVGLPGQTVMDLAADILHFKDDGIHMIGIGPFLPAANTPWADQPPGDLHLCLRVVALTRIVCQNVFLPATTAMATLHPRGQELALRAGANTIMLIMTPPQYRGNYQIYSNKNPVNLNYALEQIARAGRRPPRYLRQG
ncbi:biotin synthase [Carboxydocella sporoproducens DSM 16521]|uniref:Biotin synthase n=2 Tax=Carboxydocella TaxID=178898 RepID=A0A1T4S510_9FIRM|nr:MULTISPECIES: [FeFe] hydrogenase H-cluster radical SAM maturase HydE [Carboxydocella]AVX21208.1 iron-only hydrogenase maturation protein HydE [Carboxydocella thermautotrophica]SKA22901.1 biotin synthase [Carboxydocella sporoproducens DSM 16521]